MADETSSPEALTEDDRRALRGSKFAPLPAPPPAHVARPQPRMAHPGGPVTTNKAAALAKFLERKLQQPDGLSSLNPKLVELAVKNAKDTVNASKGVFSTSGTIVRHVASFEDSSEDSGDDRDKTEEKGQRNELDDKRQKKRKKKKKVMQNTKAHKTKHKKVKS